MSQLCSVRLFQAGNASDQKRPRQTKPAIKVYQKTANHTQLTPQDVNRPTISSITLPQLLSQLEDPRLIMVTPNQFHQMRRRFSLYVSGQLPIRFIPGQLPTAAGK